MLLLGLSGAGFEVTAQRGPSRSDLLESVGKVIVVPGRMVNVVP